MVTLGCDAKDDVRLEGIGLEPGHCRFETQGPQVWLLPGNGTVFVHRRQQPSEQGWSEAPAERLVRPLQLRLFDRLSWPGPAGDSHQLRLVPGFFTHRLGLKVYVLGSAPECSVPLPYPIISRQHAAVVEAPDGQLLVDDLGSTNGTFLERDRPVVQPTAVSAGDVLYLSTFRLPLAQLQARTRQAGQRLELGEQPALIGRDPAAQLTLDEPSVSWHHARLTPLAGRPGWALLEDLGSTNGTFVDGKRVKRQEVGPGMRIGVGLQAVVELDQGRLRRNYSGDYILQAQSVGYSVPLPPQAAGLSGALRGLFGAKGAERLALLEQISFTVFPSELVALIGPSGAGKTTLLQALNGYLQPTDGRSLVNSRDLHACYESFREAIGYVPQDDIIYPELTVAESLRYTARLRLPPDTGAEEIERRIEGVLRDLDLSEARDRRIGSPLFKGISGGQRKRVNLAQELLTRPSLLFLDEPTSGLSAYDTLEVLGLLRRLADQGKTILLTIHQPGIEAYRLLDNVAILGEGRLVYYGPAVPDSMRFVAGHPLQQDAPAASPVDEKPEEALRALQQDIQRAKTTCAREHWPLQRRQVVRPWEERYKATPHYRRYVQERKVAGDQVVLRTQEDRRPRGLVGLRQWWTLVQRDLLRKGRDRVYRTIVLLQAPLLALLLGLVFGKAELPPPPPPAPGAAAAVTAVAEASELAAPLTQLTAFALFMLVVTALWFGASNSVREIVSELPVLRRERMVNLRVPAYLGSKLAVMGALAALQCALLLLVFCGFFELQGRLLELYLVLLLASLAGTGIGLALSALVPTREAALAGLPLVLIPQVLLGGAIVRLPEMAPAIRSLAALMPARWGFGAALHAEFGERLPAVIEVWFGDTPGGPAHLGVLGGFMVGLMLLTLWGVLRKHGS